MTLAVAVARDGNVWMGYDASMSGRGLVVDNARKRIVRHNVEGLGDMLIAIAGDFVMLDEVAYRWTPPPVNSASTVDWWIAEVAESLREHFTAEPLWQTVRDSDDPILAGTFLVAAAGRVWEIRSAFDVSEWWCGWGAIGSGTHIAIGAVAAALELGASPYAAVVCAMQAAGVFAEDVSPTFTIEHLSAPASG